MYTTCQLYIEKSVKDTVLSLFLFIVMELFSLTDVERKKKQTTMIEKFSANFKVVVNIDVLLPYITYENTYLSLKFKNEIV